MMPKVKIGLEIHCQLTKLKSKLFCSCIANYRNNDPNTNICPVCYGLPGSLPILNEKAIEYACMISIALNCDRPRKLSFARKNYFYPDLPKNFQITQYDSPESESNTCIGKSGKIEYSPDKVVRIKRIQLEEDPGRLVHEITSQAGANSLAYTLIDYNRAGVALVEIVTEPDFNDPKNVRLFLNKITSILEYLDVCNVNLEGSVRCDVNVSIGTGKKVEIKNVGSFKDVEKALSYEITRQKTMNLHEIEIKGETRHWDDKRKITKQSRSKEEEEDYRYFPEPDIPIIRIGNEYILNLSSKMPELPDQRRNRFISDYRLSEHVSEVLINHKEIADLFEKAVKVYNSPKSISNWIVSDLMGFIDYESLEGKSLTEIIKINEKHIAELAKLVDENKINRTVAKKILTEMIVTGEMPTKIIDSSELTRIDDSKTILEFIEKVFISEKNAINDANKNPNVANFLLGKLMQLTKGNVDPRKALEIIKEKLDKEYLN